MFIVKRLRSEVEINNTTSLNILMRLSSSVLGIEKKGDFYRVKIAILGTNNNYLHGENTTLLGALLERDILKGVSITQGNCGVREEDGYYRIVLNVKDKAENFHYFHGRKLNLNDLVVERELLFYD